MSLIAEDLLLLLLDDESGKLETTYVEPVLGGAVLIELAMSGLLEVRKSDGMWARSKVHVVSGSPRPQDPVLEDALQRIGEKERTAQDLVGRLGKGLRDTLLDRLKGRGIVRLQEDRVLGLFPRKRWPAVDSSHEDAVRRDLTAALVQGVEPDQRTAALISLLSAIDRAHKSVDLAGLSKREVRKRAKAIAEGAWAAKAVRDAVAAAQAAMMAVMVATTRSRPRRRTGRADRSTLAQLKSRLWVRERFSSEK